MTGRKKDPLRGLTEEERKWLERISRSQSEPASYVVRSKEILRWLMDTIIPRQHNWLGGNAEQRRFWITYPEANEDDYDIREDLGQMGTEVKIAFPVSHGFNKNEYW